MRGWDEDVGDRVMGRVKRWGDEERMSGGWGYEGDGRRRMRGWGVDDGDGVIGRVRTWGGEGRMSGGWGDEGDGRRKRGWDGERGGG